jgi:hypothetical protein
VPAESAALTTASYRERKLESRDPPSWGVASCHPNAASVREVNIRHLEPGEKRLTDPEDVNPLVCKMRDLRNWRVDTVAGIAPIGTRSEVESGEIDLDR